MAKLLNSYANSFGALYAQIPKAVFAAVVYSYCSCGGDLNREDAIKNFLDEWGILHRNGIVPQAPEVKP